MMNSDAPVTTIISANTFGFYYLRCCLVSEGIVSLGLFCLPSCLHHISTARRMSLGGEGNVLYPVLSLV